MDVEKNGKPILGIKSVALRIGVGLLLSSCTMHVVAEEPYELTWESVNKHNPGGVAPLWLRDGKFGIYYHWGAYSVPAFREKGFGEWYGKWMNDPESGQNKYHKEHYGDPADWPYHFFINGAKDKAGNWVKFEPKLKSEGGKWDPDAWAQLIYDSGAKFAGPIAEHHDGYSMWKSKCNEWNVYDKTGLDIAGEMIKALRKKDLKIIATFHHAYPTVWKWWNPGSADPVPEYGPEKSRLSGDESLQKLYGQLPMDQKEKLWLDKLDEFIEAYQPDLIYHDVGVGKLPDAVRIAHLAHYYNSAAKWGKDVVVVYKLEDMNINCAILDFEGGASDDISTYFWLCDHNIGPGSWSYVKGMSYYPSKTILHSLITIVSKNGALLQNLSPLAEGTIPQAQKDLILDVGRWLNSYGESIYKTRPWATYGEGPSHSSHGFKACGATDIRFTRNIENSVLYAIVCGWPEDGLTITSMTPANLDVSTLQKVELLGQKAGTATALKWKQTAAGLEVATPGKKPFDEDAYPIRLTFSGTIPTSPVMTLPPLISTELGGKGVIISNDRPAGKSKKKETGIARRFEPGSYTKAQLKELGFKDNSILSLKVNAGWTVILYEDDNFKGKSLECKYYMRDLRAKLYNSIGKKVSSLKVIKGDKAIVFE